MILIGLMLKLEAGHATQAWHISPVTTSRDVMV